MSAQTLLDRLDKVKALPAKGTAQNWKACCPAHDDSDPSLAITELPDGRVLLHCWAGCSALDVITAVGLGWEAVMPPEDNYKPLYRSPRKQPRLDKLIDDTLGRLDAASVDEIVLALCKADRAKGVTISDKDLARERLAFERRRKAS